MKSISLLSLILLTSNSIASYAPSYIACPSTPLLRLSGSVAGGNQTINADEVAYITAKQSSIDSSFRNYLGNLTKTVYGGNLSSTPKIGISLSGGGDRAALFGAAALSALDGRNATSVSSGLGGLLQSATYVAALSGNSWMLSSLIFNDFPQIYPMVLGDGTNSTGWNLNFDVFSPGNSTTQQQQFVASILNDLSLKKAAGSNINVTFNDYWARALSHHFLPGTTAANFFDNSSSDHGASITFSSATQLSSFKDHSLPFPIISTIAQSPANKDKPLPFGLEPISSVAYEITPFEFGSYDPQLSAFIPIGSLGTALNAGTPYGGSSVGNCVTNFDNAGFILGTSSNLFSVYNDTNSYLWTSSISPINQGWTAVNATFNSVQPHQELDISAIPNPFQGINTGNYIDSSETQLTLVDGGEAGINNPVLPLIAKSRAVDVLIVVDASSDTLSSTPNGQALIGAQDRSALYPNGTVLLPPLPTAAATFIAQGLNVRPTFFGCAATPAKLNGTAQTAAYPILIYLPNYDPNFITNTSTSQFIYPQAQKFLDSGVAVINRGISSNNGTTADPLWPTCLACAVVERVRAREGVDLTPACVECFSRYCWSGVEGAINISSNGGNSTNSPSSNNGTTKATGNNSSGASSLSSISSFITVLMVLVGLVVSTLA